MKRKTLNAASAKAELRALLKKEENGQLGLAEHTRLTLQTLVAILDEIECLRTTVLLGPLLGAALSNLTAFPGFGKVVKAAKHHPPRHGTAIALHRNPLYDPKHGSAAARSKKRPAKGAK